MKTCICGYKKGSDWDKEEKDIGDMEFVTIIGMFFKKGYHYNKQEIQLIACPKCGIVQMNKDY